METYKGHVRTPGDAIILFEACRLGLLPRVQRRLSEKERQSITSGSVFVWDEREAGMRRWTDGKSWSASRVSGSFLTYREMEGKRGGNGFAAPLAATRAGKTPDSTRGSDSDLDMAGTGDDGHDGYRYKPDGLMKQSFSITTSSGNHLHLISYYARSHPNAGGLCNPSTDPQLRHIRPQKGMYPESTVQEQQNIPAVTRAPMASAPYSTVPQMAGYARSGPSQQQMQYNVPNYNGWAPQPHWNNQNGNGPGYQPYGHQYGGQGPPMPHEHSPLSHSQSIGHPTSEPQQILHPHAHPYGRSPGPQYNRSPAPNENLGPPHQHHRTSSSGSHHHQYRSYPAERPPPSGPPHQQAHYAYEQPSSATQAPTQYYSHQPPYAQSDQPPYPPSQHPQHYAPPQHYPPSQSYAHSQHSPQQQPHLPNRNHAQQQPATPTMPQIDPRLMAPSTLSQQQHQQQRQVQNQSQQPRQYQSQHQPTSSSSPSSLVPTSVIQDGAPKPASQASTNANGTSQSQASTIPSIGSIMNGPPPTSNPNTVPAKNGPPSTSNPNSAVVMKGPMTPATPTSIENINAANVNANADATSERSGTKSPVSNTSVNGNNKASANGNGNTIAKTNTNTNAKGNANGNGNGNTTQEIPKEKLGFNNEDVRALRVLDRAFRT